MRVEVVVGKLCASWVGHGSSPVKQQTRTRWGVITADWQALHALLRRGLVQSQTQNYPGKLVTLHRISPGRIMFSKMGWLWGDMAPDQLYKKIHLVIGFCEGRDMAERLLVYKCCTPVGLWVVETICHSFVSICTITTNPRASPPAAFALNKSISKWANMKLEFMTTFWMNFHIFSQFPWPCCGEVSILLLNGAAVAQWGPRRWASGCTDSKSSLTTSL